MKILMITSEFPPVVGGVASVVDELSKAMVEQGHEVRVLATVKGVEEFTLPGRECFQAKVIRARPFYTWTLRGQIKKAVAEWQPDAVHVHGMRPLEASKGLSVPVFFTNHTSGFLKRLEAGRDSFWSPLSKRMEHLAGIVAPSDELIEAAKKAGYQGPTCYVPNAVKPDAFCPGEGGQQLREKHGIGEDEFVAVLARRLVEKNGVLDFARAFAHLKGVRPLVVGDGVLRAQMEELFQEAGVDAVLTGSIPNREMVNYFRAADIAVLPSYMEATSVAGLEAMAVGLPLVGTRVGGIPDLIDEGGTGYLVSPRAPEELAQKIQDFQKEPQKASEMGRQARAKVLAQFTWERVAERTLSWMKEVMK